MDTNIIQDTRLINLYSGDAYSLNGTKKSNTVFNFINILSDEDQIINCTIGVVSAQIPVSFYTITENNNVFRVNASTVQITKGNYDANRLITEITKKLFSVGITISITISKVTGLLTFSSDIPIALYPSSLMPLLGFLDIAYTSSSVILKNIITAPYPVNLLGIQKLNINSSALSAYNSNSNSFGESTTIATIPCTASPFGMIFYNNQNSYSLLKSKTISSIDIQIVDENDLLIDFNNIDWSLTLQLTIFRRIEMRVNNRINLQPILKLLQNIDNDLLGKKSESLGVITENPESLETNNDDDLDTLIYKGII